MRPFALSLQPLLSSPQMIPFFLSLSHPFLLSLPFIPATPLIPSVSPSLFTSFSVPPQSSLPTLFSSHRYPSDSLPPPPPAPYLLLQTPSSAWDPTTTTPQFALPRDEREGRRGLEEQVQRVRFLKGREGERGASRGEGDGSFGEGRGILTPQLRPPLPRSH